jgi:hypothetical protein
MVNYLKLIINFVLVLVVFTSAPQVLADDLFIEEQVLEGTQTTIRLLKSKDRRYREYYRTWHVIEVNEELIFLERTKKNGKVVKTSIEVSRRPYLKVGDRVRYDKIRNRLGKTLDK